MNETVYQTRNLPSFSRIQINQVESDLERLLDNNRQTLELLLKGGKEYSWENLVHPIEEMQDELHRFWSPISHLHSVADNDELRKVYNKCIPKLTEYNTEMGQNEDLFHAYEQLAEEGCDLVLGPSDDGGYYLVGLKRPVEGIFHDIPWSTDRVLDTTLARARELVMKVGLLPRAYDIDVEADLVRLWNDFGKFEEWRALAPRTFDYLRSLIDNGSLPPIHALASSRVKRAQNVRKP